jgi:hypothetical protein
MGQYYKPISIDKNEFVNSHDYDNGLKLMEHSWIGNNLMSTIMNMLQKGGRWFNTKIVWAGDYADDEMLLGGNLYDLVSTKINPTEKREKDVKHLRFLVNRDKNEYVDLKSVPVSYIYSGVNYCVHPLSLLTCEGNGRGGGDYRGNDVNSLIGSWARNRIKAQKSKPRNCKKIVFDLVV